MKKIANTFILLSLILLVLVNSSGFFIYFQAETYSAKQNFKYKLHSIVNTKDLPEEIIKIVVKKSDKIQPEFSENYEFEYNGEMYDIITKVVSGDSTIYSVLLDEDETKLFTTYRKHLENEKKNDNKILKELNNEYLTNNIITFNFDINDFRQYSNYHIIQSTPATNQLLHPPCLIS